LIDFSKVPNGKYNYGVLFTSRTPEFREKIEPFVPSPEQRHLAV